jgi:hypothetical protein
MSEMAAKFDELIRVQGHPVFNNYRSYIAKKAREHALKELERYRERQRLGHDKQ